MKRKEIVIGVAMVTFFAFMFAMLAVAINRDVEARYAARQAELARRAALVAEGCRITSYVASKYDVYGVYTCPDGRVDRER